MLRLLRLATALFLVIQAITASRRAPAHHAFAYMLLVAAFVILAGVIVIHEVEIGHAQSNIHSRGDATWWAFETVVTTGCETPWPASEEGRVVRVVLVLVGLGPFGLITPPRASWLVGFGEEKHDAARQRELEDRLDRLQATLDALMAQRADDSAPAQPPKPQLEDAT